MPELTEKKMWSRRRARCLRLVYYLKSDKSKGIWGFQVAREQGKVTRGSMVSKGCLVRFVMQI